MEKELQFLGDLLKMVLPASIVLYAVYLTIKALVTKDFEKKLVELKLKNTELVLPIRLQAYERMCLFLERISPNTLIVRVNDPSYNVAQLHQLLLIHQMILLIFEVHLFETEIQLDYLENQDTRYLHF